MNTSQNQNIQKQYFITIEDFLYTLPNNELKESLDIYFDAETSTYKQDIFDFIHSHLWTAYERKYAGDLKVDVIEMFCGFILKYNVDAPRRVREFTDNLIQKSMELCMADSELGPRIPNSIRKYLLTHIGITQDSLLSLFVFYFDLTEHLNVFATIDYVNLQRTFEQNLPRDISLGIKLEQPVVVLIVNGKAGTKDVFDSSEEFTQILADRLRNELDKKHDLTKFYRNGNIMLNEAHTKNVAMMMNNNLIKAMSPKIFATGKTLTFIDTILISTKNQRYNNYCALRLYPIPFNLIPAIAFDFSL